MNTLRIRSYADTIGVVSSLVCALHCLIAPSLLVLGAAVPVSFFADEYFHVALLWLILPSAVLAFALGCWRHKDRIVLLLGTIGLVGITAAALVLHDIIGESGERIVTLIATAFLIAAHWRNFSLCREDHCEH